MKSKVIAAALLLVSGSVSAQSMNAETFYQRASALQKKGVLALLSGDLSSLLSEGKAAGAKAREQRLAALAAGHKPRFCPPSQPMSMDSDEFMKRMAQIPAAERSRIDMTEATTRILAAKFPCRA
jgi:tRNA U34 5-methylaminomethyl-2-thiouridine-forming methyltransferase MnmC